MSLPVITFGLGRGPRGIVAMIDGVRLPGSSVSAELGTLGVTRTEGAHESSNDDVRTAVVRTHPRFVARLVRDGE